MVMKFMENKNCDLVIDCDRCTGCTYCLLCDRAYNGKYLVMNR